MDANIDDEFKDAVDEEEFTDAVDHEAEFTDAEGFVVRLPKVWNFDNSFEFESEDLKQVFQGADPGNTALTKEMLTYQPQECFLSYGKSKPVRLLYYPVDEAGPSQFTADEKAFIRTFKDHCKQNGRPVPDSDSEILRQLYGRKFDVAKTLAQIDEIEKFKMESFPLKVTGKTFELLNNGFTYISGRDRLYRPVVITRPRVFNEMPDPKPSNEEVLAALILLQWYIRKYMMCNGRIENVIQVMDLSGNFKIPFAVTKFALSRMPKLNRGRARTFFVVNTSSTISFLWQGVRLFLDENTQNKVSFSSTNTTAALQQLVAPEQLEQQFGGQAKNKEVGEYWPPSLPSDNFGAAEINIDGIKEEHNVDVAVSQNDTPMTEEQAQKLYQEENN